MNTIETTHVGSRPVALTGDRPTGPLHLGHLAGSLLERVRLQDACDQFVLIADLQALTDNAGTPQKVQGAVSEIVADYIAVGLDPDRTTMCLQSAIPELTELTLLYLNLVTVSRLERNPTIRDEIKMRGFDRNIPAGFLCYPAAQAADITGFKANLVPVGNDQLPMIELAQELAARVNGMAGTELLPRPTSVLSTSPRLPGIDGRAKASKSLGNAIFIKDDPDVVREKVRMMFTDPGHIRASDPGRVEDNVVFAYLDAFSPDQDAVDELKRQYRQGGLGDVRLKRNLFEILDSMLRPMRERRADIHPVDAAAILKRGTERARSVVAATLREVKAALGVPSIF